MSWNDGVFERLTTNFSSLFHVKVIAMELISVELIGQRFVLEHLVRKISSYVNSLFFVDVPFLVVCITHRT